MCSNNTFWKIFAFFTNALIRCFVSLFNVIGCLPLPLAFWNWNGNAPRNYNLSTKSYLLHICLNSRVSNKPDVHHSGFREWVLKLPTILGFFIFKMPSCWSNGCKCKQQIITSTKFSIILDKYSLSFKKYIIRLISS